VDGQPVVHEFVNNVCIVNDRAEVGSPRALKIEGATHVHSLDNVWAYGQLQQSPNNSAGIFIEHIFDQDIFRHRGEFSLPLGSIFLSGSDVDWLANGTLEIEGPPGPPLIHRSWNGANANFVGTLDVVDVPEPSFVPMLLIAGGPCPS
jgi:hypothetical protein